MTVPMNDRVSWFGDGVYDAGPSRNYKIFALDEHIDRFFNSAGLLKIQMPVTKNRLKGLLQGMVEKMGTGSLFVYYQVTRGTGIRDHVFTDGPGNLKEVIREELSLVPCEVTVDTLVISIVSNWGAYAVEAYMQQIKKVRLLPAYKEIKRYLETIVRMGSMDGVTGRQTASVDGFPLEVERKILQALDVAASAAEKGEERKAG